MDKNDVEKERAMYYSQELIEEVRSRSDILEVISHYVSLKKKGSSHFGLCPFHNEKTPSFSVSQDKQMYYCFGCGTGGNVITFVMEYENFTFQEAVKYLAEQSGIDLPTEDTSQEARQQMDMKQTLFDLHKLAAKYYYYQLISKRGENALKYFEDRGVSEDIRKKFGLGYSNMYGQDLYKYLKQQGYSDTILKDSGLVSFDEIKGGYDRFWNRAMFPILDVHHRVIGFGGRVLGDGMPKYLNSPETKIFDKSRNLYGLNIARTARKSSIIICEGYMDVIALHQAGFSNAVASLGTAFTHAHANLLRRYTNEVHLIYDSDDAGVAAAMRAIPILKEAGLLVKVVDLLPYKDPDDFIKNLSANAFEERLKNAKNSFIYEVQIIERSFNLGDPESKTRFFNRIAEKLLEFTTEIERDNYIEAIANNYQINQNHLRQLVNRIGAQVGFQEKKNTNYTKKEDKEEGILQSQRILINWIVNHNHLIVKVMEIISPSDFQDPFYQKVIALICKQYEEDGQVLPAKVLNEFADIEEQKRAAAMFNKGLQGELSQQEFEKALNETVLKIKKYSLDEASRNANDIGILQKIIQEQRELQNLHISL